jgi:ankyrin repeat protein
VRLLIEQGVDVTAQDEAYSTPLHFASSSGVPEIARLLIEHGADVTARDRSHRTPLHLASSWVSSGTALSLIQLRDDVNGQEDSSWAPSSYLKADTVKLLIGHGSDVMARDATQSTPLHLASSFGSTETVRRLIEHGADVTARDGNHRTPLHLASARVSAEIKAETVQLFHPTWADVNGRTGPNRGGIGGILMTKLIQCNY